MTQSSGKRKLIESIDNDLKNEKKVAINDEKTQKIHGKFTVCDESDDEIIDGEDLEVTQKVLPMHKRKDARSAQLEKEMGGDVENPEEPDPEEKIDEKGIIIEPFNMKNDFCENLEFDSGGNVIRNSSKSSVKDCWLDMVDDTKSLFKSEEERLMVLKKIEEASEEKEAPTDIQGVLRRLIPLLKEGETPTGALLHSYTEDAPPRFDLRKKKKNAKAVAGKLGEEEKKKFDEITETCSLLTAGGLNPYFLTKEKLSELCEKGLSNMIKIGETGENDFWEYRWLRDRGTVHGPFTTKQIRSWIDQKLINEEQPVELRQVTQEGDPLDGLWRRFNLINFNVEEDENIENV
eukprot:GHVL01000485.1.p1 GENE.GHVL01000485.1~~GHVL01000485.1.p1  ORF type:complete len:348 (+),score=101.04 GHVL01000485.1:24-1067(+)